MKTVWILLLTVLVGCEGDSIAQCSYACQRTYRVMVKYNAADGCVCGEALKEAK